MGLETVATVLSVASAANNLLNAPKTPKVSTMPWEQAYAQAGAQLNPLYDKRMKDVLANVQNDLISRGFAGQQAGTELSTETAAENERQRLAALAGLAQSIQQGYNDQSYRNAALQYESELARHNAINSALSNTASWLSDRSWVSRPKERTKSEMETDLGYDLVTLPALRYNYSTRWS